jgi:nucleoid-associated protein YgaU
VGNFEKLSVVVIVVIIVMILAVAVVEWTSGPAEAPPAEPAPVADVPAKAAVEPYRAPAKPEAAKSKPAIKKDEAPSSEPAVDPLLKWNDDWTSLPPVEKKPEGEKAAKPAETPKAATPTTTPDIAETTHVVASGETLQVIAKKHYDRMSLWPVIVDANPGLRPESLRPGQTLKIPARKGVPMAASGSGAAMAAGPGAKPVPGQEYTVRANDTWERISAAAYNTSARWPEIYLKNLNRVKDQKDLPPGKVILIPK